MKTCFACARKVDNADRFCGHCGADQATVVAVQAPAAEPGQAPSETPAKTGLRGGRTVVASLVLIGLAALATLAWLIFGRNGEPGTVRVAFDNIFSGAGSDEPVTEPSEEPTTEPSDEPTDEADEETAEAQAASTTPSDGTIFLQPGRWQFTTQLVAVSKVNPADNFEISRQGIGSSESHSVCVTPAAAEQPRAIAFPFQQGLACSPSSFSMANGSYSSRLTCSFPQFGGRRPVTANGQYSRSTASLNVTVQIPAQVVEGDFEEPPEILMQYRMLGYLTGPC